MHSSNTTNLLVGLNFTGAAHNPELIMDPVERVDVPNELFEEFIESIVTAPNVGEPFDQTYTPHGGGPGYQVPNDATVNLTISSEDGGERLRVAGSNGTHVTYQRR